MGGEGIPSLLLTQHGQLCFPIVLVEYVRTPIPRTLLFSPIKWAYSPPAGEHHAPPPAGGVLPAPKAHHAHMGGLWLWHWAARACASYCHRLVLPSFFHMCPRMLGLGGTEPCPCLGPSSKAWALSTHRSAAKKGRLSLSARRRSLHVFCSHFNGTFSLSTHTERSGAVSRGPWALQWHYFS